MRIPRIYHPQPLHRCDAITLSDDASHHVSRVLRMTVGEQLILFDGSNTIFNAVITSVTKKNVCVNVQQAMIDDRESPLIIHLGQVISRGEKMEFTIQKSVELGVNAITPLISERCGVKLDPLRLQRKQQQWHKIVIAACEQCGRNQLPIIHPVQTLTQWCAEPYHGLKLNLHPRANQRIKTLRQPIHDLRLLIGSEGGLSTAEIEMVNQQGFIDILLGPRVLRTETASLAAIAALQARFGDLG